MPACCSASQTSCGGLFPHRQPQNMKFPAKDKEQSPQPVSELCLSTTSSVPCVNQTNRSPLMRDRHSNRQDVCINSFGSVTLRQTKCDTCLFLDGVPVSASQTQREVQVTQCADMCCVPRWFHWASEPRVTLSPSSSVHSIWERKTRAGMGESGESWAKETLGLAARWA